MLNDQVLKLFRRFTILMAGVGVLIAAAIAMIYSDGDAVLYKVLPSVILGFTSFGIGIDNFTAPRRRRILVTITIGLVFSLIGTAIGIVGQPTAFSVWDFLMYFVSFGFLAFLPEEFVSRNGDGSH